MTLLYVIILDIGIILIVSAFENKSLRETFSDILNGDITPATDSSTAPAASTGIGTTILPATGPAGPTVGGAIQAGQGNPIQVRRP